jgi:hypothetical protein
MRNPERLLSLFVLLILLIVGCSLANSPAITMIPVVWADTSPSKSLAKSVVMIDPQTAQWSTEYTCSEFFAGEDKVIPASEVKGGVSCQRFFALPSFFLR